MVTDRGRSYDAQALSGVKQQKCLAHVLRSISEVVQTKRGRGRSFGNRLSRLLREAMEFRQAYHRGEAADFAAEAERLRREATYHLRDRPMSDADNWRLQNELGWHDDRGNLLRFLDDPSIEPTNNRAERALPWGSDRAEGIALLEERRWCGCVLGLHQRNQDPGSQWRRSLAGQRALRCVQRCSGPHPFLLNLSSHSAPLINYPETLLEPRQGRHPEVIGDSEKPPIRLPRADGVHPRCHHERGSHRFPIQEQSHSENLDRAETPPCCKPRSGRRLASPAGRASDRFRRIAGPRWRRWRRRPRHWQAAPKSAV